MPALLAAATTVGFVCVYWSRRLLAPRPVFSVASIIPMVLRRLRIDPAVVSAPFISTLVDGTGLIIYFEIAKWLLPELQ